MELKDYLSIWKRVKVRGKRWRNIGKAFRLLKHLEDRVLSGGNDYVGKI